MNEYKHIERIESYLSGEFSTEEKHRFQKDLVSNRELKKEYELYLKSNKAVQELKRQYLKDKIQQYSELESRKLNDRTWFSKLFKIAITIIALLALILLASYFYASKNYCNHCLADMESFDLFTEMNRGLQNEKELQLNAITQLLQQEKYEEVVEEIQLIDSIQAYPAFFFLKINALTNAGNHIQAKEELLQMQTYNNTLISELSDWQLVQTYLLLNDVDEAIKKLNEILSSEVHGYATKAAQLKSDLNHPLRKLAE